MGMELQAYQNRGTQGPKALVGFVSYSYSQLTLAMLLVIGENGASNIRALAFNLLDYVIDNITNFKDSIFYVKRIDWENDAIGDNISSKYLSHK